MRFNIFRRRQNVLNIDEDLVTQDLEEKERNKRELENRQKNISLRVGVVEAEARARGASSS